MSLFAHHMKGFIDLEIMGYELTPEGTTEHIIAAAIVGVMAVLMAYGAYALIRDMIRWRRRSANVNG
jgi:hypothetical protein